MNIEFHYTYIIIAISFILTGHFSNLIIFTIIILFHEMGHYIVAKMQNLNPKKIVLYPYGGITYIDNLINTKISKELMVAMAGIVFQIFLYLIVIILYKYHIIRDYIFNIYQVYHYNILIFNLIPIHPLDGSKIVNLILSKYLPYKLTLKLTVIISVITTIIIIKINYYQVNYALIMIATLIIDHIIKYCRNINYLFNKFLLERYLYNFTFLKRKKIKKITNIYKEKYHIISKKNNYLTEKQYLKQYFGQKY